jgi:hypothetical protein
MQKLQLEHLEAFDKLKFALKNAPILAHPDYMKIL